MSCLPKIGEIKIIRGQALDINITVPQGVDLASATVTFGIADSATSPYTTTLPTTKTGNGKVITAQLSGADSAQLNRAKHYYSCWLEISGDPTPVARGFFKIENDSRNR